MLPPRRCREVSAERIRKGLSLRSLALLARVDYFVACRVLRGRMVNRAALLALENAVRKAPKPREEAFA